MSSPGGDSLCAAPVMLTVSANRETKPRDVTSQGSRALINVKKKKSDFWSVLFIMAAIP